MDIGSLYRKNLAESHSRAEVAGHDETADGMMVEVGDLVDVAYRELDSARRKADVTLATARAQGSRVYREARRDARKLLVKARKKADRLQEIGRSRAEVARREAYEQGREEGRAAAREEARTEIGSALSRLLGLADELAESTKEHEADAEERCARFMLTMVRRVVGTLDAHVESLLFDNLVLAISQHFDEDEQVFVRCHPDDIEEIDKIQLDLGGEGITAAFTDGRVSLRADRALARGQCRLWSERAGVAFSFDERLQALERELLAALASERPRGS